MRWVNFRALREILLLVQANPARLRPADLMRLTTEERVLIGRNGQALGLSSHYHHRRTLERLGLLVKREGRYVLNEHVPETKALTERVTFGSALDDREREAFSNVVLRNEDCRSVFFQWFLQPLSGVHNVEEFGARANPIELNVIRVGRGPGNHNRRALDGRLDVDQHKHVVIRASGAPGWSTFSGTNAVQAIHFGLRAWCVDQLQFLDGIYRTGAGYTIYARRIRRPCTTSELAFRMLDLLGFDGDWATVRVGDFALDVGIRQHVSIEQVKDVLNSWMENYPDVVAGIPTNERFVAGGLASGLRKAVLKGFLRESQGAIVSHLRIHRSLRERIGREVLRT